MKAFKNVTNQGNEPAVKKAVNLPDDSINLGWVYGWVKKGFKDKANPDLWKRFLVVFRKHHVDFKWIKGHNNHPQNERCDELAVMASSQNTLSVDTFYEKEDDKLF